MDLSEWEPLLDDLEEMGFPNRAVNTRLLVETNGSLKATVRILVTEAP